MVSIISTNSVNFKQLQAQNVNHVTYYFDTYYEYVILTFIIWSYCLLITRSLCINNSQKEVDKKRNNSFQTVVLFCFLHLNTNFIGLLN